MTFVAIGKLEEYWYFVLAFSFGTVSSGAVTGGGVTNGGDLLLPGRDNKNAKRAGPLPSQLC